MAKINCPHGHRWISVRAGGNLIIEDRVVTIFNGVCDSCDLCHFRECEYFDDTKEGTRKFCQGAACHASIEAILQAREYEQALREKHQQ